MSVLQFIIAAGHNLMMIVSSLTSDSPSSFCQKVNRQFKTSKMKHRAREDKPKMLNIKERTHPGPQDFFPPSGLVGRVEEDGQI